MKKLLCGTVAALMIALPLYAQTSSSTATSPSDSSMNSGSSTVQGSGSTVDQATDSTSTTIESKEQRMEETKTTTPTPGTESSTVPATETSEDAQMQQDNSTINPGSSDLEMQQEPGVGAETTPSASGTVTTPSDDIEEEE